MASMLIYLYGFFSLFIRNSVKTKLSLNNMHVMYESSLLWIQPLNRQII